MLLKVTTEKRAQNHFLPFFVAVRFAFVYFSETLEETVGSNVKHSILNIK